MASTGEVIIGVLALALAWYFFYAVIRAKTSRGRRLKVTIVVLIFASLILRFSHDLYALVSRTLFSFKKQGEVELVTSPFNIPASQNNAYCQQFTDQNNKAITLVSVREDGRYCGEFWQFKTRKSITIPYKTLDATHTIYWASSSLQIIGPKQ